MGDGPNGAACLASPATAPECRAVRQAVEACARLGVPYLTLYAFSVENWKRPHTEIKLLMGLLREYLKKEISELNRQNIRLEVIGRIQELLSRSSRTCRMRSTRLGRIPDCAWSWR